MIHDIKIIAGCAAALYVAFFVLLAVITYMKKG